MEGREARELLMILSAGGGFPAGLARGGITLAGDSLVRTEELKRKSVKRLERRGTSLHWSRVETFRAAERDRAGGSRSDPA